MILKWKKLHGLRHFFSNNCWWKQIVIVPTNTCQKSTKKTKTYTNKGKMSFLGLYSFKMHWGEQDNCPVVGQVKI